MASDSSRSSWAIFAGGIALGSAAAAGAAYAATSYFLRQQELALQQQQLQQLQQQQLQTAARQQRPRCAQQCLDMHICRCYLTELVFTLHASNVCSRALWCQHTTTISPSQLPFIRT
jgi:hypothetical protein